MTTGIDIGETGGGVAGGPGRGLLDLEELLASRLLVQGNSGSGKSHLLRRLLEQSAGLVQQIVIDPEGDFVTLAAAFGHHAIEAADYAEAEIVGIAARVRQHRVSVVLNLEGLEVDAQLRCAGVFLNRLFDAPRDQWYPALVVVDEAQLFAPAAAGDVGEEARRVSLGAMTNLMCRGRKRGLAGVIATQRLAKLAKNVAAEASNFLMGRTFLDIDMARAADLLGMERRQAEQIRDLARGQFLALGPALSRRPLLIRIGEVRTGAASGGLALSPLPALAREDGQALLFDALEEQAPPPPPPPRAREPAETVLAKLAAASSAPTEPAMPELAEGELEDRLDAVLAEIVADGPAGRSGPIAYQDFVLRCRMRGLALPPLAPPAFARRLAFARAGVFAVDIASEAWTSASPLADEVPEDALAVFLLIARAGLERLPCPSDAEIAAIYGTHSLGRARRLLAYLEQKGHIAFRTDLRGRRTAAIPRLGWTTEPEAATGAAA